MADCIEELITQNLKDRLETLQTYPGNATPTVERERLILHIGGRYPYIMLIGPQNESDDKTPYTTLDNLTYIIKYYINKSDENNIIDNELPNLTKNVSADIVRHIMNDVSRNQLAQNTELLSDGYSYDLSEEGNWEYYIYVIIEISALINKLDPYVIG